MSANHFFAMLSRMKYINRWGLMRNTFTENISEHSLDVAIIAHALTVIHNKKFDGSLNPERVALLGLYHDATEIITGDLPTPVKYFNDEIREAYRQVEELSSMRLLAMLPKELQEEYAPLLSPNENEAELWHIVKAADKLSALIKCIEEEKAGNREFSRAYAATLESLEKMELPEVQYFMENMLPGYQLTLDEQEELL